MLPFRSVALLSSKLSRPASRLIPQTLCGDVVKFKNVSTTNNTSEPNPVPKRNLVTGNAPTTKALTDATAPRNDSLLDGRTELTADDYVARNSAIPAGLETIVVQLLKFIKQTASRRRPGLYDMIRLKSNFEQPAFIVPRTPQNVIGDTAQRTVRAVQAAWAKIEKRCEENGRDRISNSLVAFFGPPGSGKTFDLNLVLEDTRGGLRIGITFNGITPFSSPTAISDDILEALLVSRLIVNYAFVPNLLIVEHLVKVATEYFQDPKNAVSVSTVLAHFVERHGSVVLAIDEIVKLGHPSNVTLCLHTLCVASDSTPGVRLVVSTLNSLLVSQVTTESGRYVVWVQVFPPDIQAVWKELSPDVKADPQYRRMMILCGSNWRLLRYLVKRLQSEKADLHAAGTAKTIFKALLVESRRLHPTVTIPFDLLHAALCGSPLNITDVIDGMPLAKYISNGTLANIAFVQGEPVIIPVFIPLILYRWAISRPNVAAHRTICEQLQAIMHFEPLEYQRLQQVQMAWEILQHELHCGKTMSLLEFYSRTPLQPRHSLPADVQNLRVVISPLRALDRPISDPTDAFITRVVTPDAIFLTGRTGPGADIIKFLPVKGTNKYLPVGIECRLGHARTAKQMTNKRRKFDKFMTQLRPHLSFEILDWWVLNFVNARTNRDERNYETPVPAGCMVTSGKLWQRTMTPTLLSGVGVYEVKDYNKQIKEVAMAPIVDLITGQGNKEGKDFEQSGNKNDGDDEEDDNEEDDEEDDDEEDDDEEEDDDDEDDDDEDDDDEDDDDDDEEDDEDDKDMKKGMKKAERR